MEHFINNINVHVFSRSLSLSLFLLALSPCGVNLEGQSVELRKGELGELLWETQTWELCGSRAQSHWLSQCSFPGMCHSSPFHVLTATLLTSGWPGIRERSPVFLQGLLALPSPEKASPRALGNRKDASTHSFPIVIGTEQVKGTLELL